MDQYWSFKAARTCPKCKKEDAIYAETIDEEQKKDQIHFDQQGITFRYTINLYVNVSCRYCGFLGSTILSKCDEGGSRGDKDDAAKFWGAQDYPIINPDDAIEIVIDRLKHPRHRWTAPW